MSTVNLAVVYYSATGTVDAMARYAAEAAEKAGAEVRLRQVARQVTGGERATSEAQAAHAENALDTPAATADDVVWADAVLFGSPTRYGNIAGQLKTFLDSLGPQWGQGLLADKVYAGFTASQTAHGGQETTLLALYNTIHHFGGIIVAPGYTDPLKFVDGNPYGVSHVTGANNDIPLGDADIDALRHLASRVVTVAEKLKN
ncbi:NAD(P)H:quinone oxidoreductase type IV [Pseudonocardia sulfidoxydans NBRC 16205]|uniref:NAD(P)H:quinone oxidoreductase type IV n=1 Tax=Pseudonocardia sulfidoxydans NBRC 16205 TaxID=1223511 RepID=A0A511DRK6_9PSEU|nr:NAD(P)H:quinone oxidoreductase [Pseudonocardia sulfidoxydans]GEL26374.1 NAD(P)H:quinone oxidoreductase type IV [Pseudonocardia sulfidoxydans NBRC 16205]